MAISCEKFTQMLDVISKEHKIDMQALIDSLETKELLPKKMMTTKSTISKDKGPFDNKRAKEFAEANGICIKDVVGTGREGRITVADMKNVMDLPVTGKAKVSDAAKKLAQEHGIDINNVTPSGKRGDILLKDIKMAIENAPVQPLVIEEEEEEKTVIEEEPVIEEEEEPEIEMD